jgi:DEAD/DEAH box helicase domain-containing protein
LRSIADGNFVIVDRTDGRQTIIAETDYSSAALTLYEGAIYMVQSAPYQVERLDWEGRKAYVRQTQVDYYTDAIDYTRLKVLDRFDGSVAANGTCHHGEVHVVRHVSGYKKIRFYSHENIGYGPVNLPDQEMHTTALWWQLSAEILHGAFSSAQDALDGFLGAAYALHIVASVRVMADGRDLQKSVGSGDATWFAVRDRTGRGQWRDAAGSIRDGALANFNPTLFLYDNFPGGIGLSEPLFVLAPTLIHDALDIIERCECSDGCPSCIGPVIQNEARADRSPRELAAAVLTLLCS